jgi:hypothetical protein
MWYSPLRFGFTPGKLSQPRFPKEFSRFRMTGQMRASIETSPAARDRVEPFLKSTTALKCSRLQQSTFANTTSNRYIVGLRRAMLEASFSGPSKGETPFATAANRAQGKKTGERTWMSTIINRVSLLRENQQEVAAPVQLLV